MTETPYAPIEFMLHTKHPPPRPGPLALPLPCTWPQWWLPRSEGRL